MLSQSSVKRFRFETARESMKEYYHYKNNFLESERDHFERQNSVAEIDMGQRISLGILDAQTRSSALTNPQKVLYAKTPDKSVVKVIEIHLDIDLDYSRKSRDRLSLDEYYRSHQLQPVNLL